MENQAISKPKRNSPAHRRQMQEDVINAIESSEFFSKDIYEELEQYYDFEKETNEEIEENLKRQKEIEEELKKDDDSKENLKEDQDNDYNYKKETIKDKKELNDELKKLKLKEKDLRNRLEQAKQEITDAICQAIKAKDIGELIRALVKAWQAREQKKVMKGNLKSFLEEKKLVNKELKRLKKFHQIARSLEKLSNDDENKNFVREMCLDVVNARIEAKKEKADLNEAKKYYNKFENYFKEYEKNNRENAMENIKKLYEEVIKKYPDYPKLYEKQNQKINRMINSQNNKTQQKQNRNQNKIAM